MGLVRGMTRFPYICPCKSRYRILHVYSQFVVAVPGAKYGAEFKHLRILSYLVINYLSQTLCYSLNLLTRWH